MFEVATDQRPDADCLRKAGDAGAQAANCAHDEVDLSPGLGCGVKSVDCLAVDKVVQFPHDPPTRAPLGFFFYELDYLRTKSQRCDYQLPIGRLAAVPGQEIEQVREVLPERRGSSQDPDILIETGCGRVVIARADVA